MKDKKTLAYLGAVSGAVLGGGIAYYYANHIAPGTAPEVVPAAAAWSAGVGRIIGSSIEGASDRAINFFRKSTIGFVHLGGVIGVMGVLNTATKPVAQNLDPSVNMVSTSLATATIIAGVVAVGLPTAAAAYTVFEMGADITKPFINGLKKSTNNALAHTFGKVSQLLRKQRPLNQSTLGRNFSVRSEPLANTAGSTQKPAQQQHTYTPQEYPSRIWTISAPCG